MQPTKADDGLTAEGKPAKAKKKNKKQELDNLKQELEMVCTASIWVIVVVVVG